MIVVVRKRGAMKLTLNCHECVTENHVSVHTKDMHTRSLHFTYKRNKLQYNRPRRRVGHQLTKKKRHTLTIHLHRIVKDCDVLSSASQMTTFMDRLFLYQMISSFFSSNEHSSYTHRMTTKACHPGTQNIMLVHTNTI